MAILRQYWIWTYIIPTHPHQNLDSVQFWGSNPLRQLGSIIVQMWKNPFKNELVYHPNGNQESLVLVALIHSTKLYLNNPECIANLLFQAMMSRGVKEHVQILLMRLNLSQNVASVHQTIEWIWGGIISRGNSLSASTFWKCHGHPCTTRHCASRIDISRHCARQTSRPQCGVANLSMIKNWRVVVQCHSEVHRITPC